MSETFWKITAVAGIGSLQMTMAWGRLNAWSTITGMILVLLLLTIPWRQGLQLAERAAYSGTLALAAILALGRFFEGQLDRDLMSRPRQIFASWAIVTALLFIAKSLTRPPESS